MSTIFDYREDIVKTMDKETLFAIVKQQSARRNHSDEWEPYKEATLSAINGVSTEYIDKKMKNIRGDDAVAYEFYQLAIEFFGKGLISKDKFITIMQVVDRDSKSGYIENKRVTALEGIGHLEENCAVEVLRAVLENDLLPKSKLHPEVKSEFLSRLWPLSKACKHLLLDYEEKAYNEVIVNFALGKVGSRKR